MHSQGRRQVGGRDAQVGPEFEDALRPGFPYDLEQDASPERRLAAQGGARDRSVQHPPAWKSTRRGPSGPGREVQDLEPPAIGQQGPPERFDSSKPLPLSLREAAGENRS